MAPTHRKSRSWRQFEPVHLACGSHLFAPRFDTLAMLALSAASVGFSAAPAAQALQVRASGAGA